MKGIRFVCLDPGISKDPRILAIAKALGKHRLWVTGCFPEFFGAVASHAPSGDLSSFDDDTLDTWAGDVKGFGSLIRTHLCENGVLRAWGRYNGKALDKLQKDRDRKAEKTDGNSTELPRKVHGASAPITSTSTTTSFSNEKESSSPRVTHVLRQMENQAPRYLEFMEGAFRGATNPDALASEMTGLTQGMNLQSGQAATWPQIGQAIQDIMANGERITARRLRVFVSDLIRGPGIAPVRRSTDPTDEWSNLEEKARARETA